MKKKHSRFLRGSSTAILHDPSSAGVDGLAKAVQSHSQWVGLELFEMRLSGTIDERCDIVSVVGIGQVKQNRHMNILIEGVCKFLVGGQINGACGVILDHGRYDSHRNSQELLQEQKRNHGWRNRKETQSDKRQETQTSGSEGEETALTRKGGEWF